MLWRPLSVGAGAAAFVLSMAGLVAYVASLQPFLSVFAVAALIALLSVGLAIATLDPVRRRHRIRDLEALVINGPSATLITGLLVTFALSKLVVMVWWGAPPLWVPAAVSGLAILAVAAAILHKLHTRYYGEAMPGHEADRLEPG